MQTTGTNDIDRITFDKLSYRYKITGSLLLINKMSKLFSISSIVQWESDMGVVYQIVKSDTDLFKFLSNENKEKMLEYLKEEYKVNVGITDKVIEIIKILASGVDNNRLMHIDDLQKTMISHMNKQGFETVSYTITISDIQNCIISLYQAYMNDPLKSIFEMISRLINQYNYKCFVSVLDIFNERESETLYEDILKISEYTISLLAELDIDSEEDTISDDIATDEEESVDYLYNVYNEAPTNKDLIRYAYEYFPIDITELPRDNAISFINAMYHMTTAGVTSDIMYNIVSTSLNKFNKYVNKQFEIISSLKERPNIVVNNLMEFAELDYRIPHLMYLVNGDFEIVRPLVDVSFTIEYSLCKKIDYIQHTYSNWYERKIMLNEEVTTDKLTEIYVNLDNLHKLTLYDDEDI